MKRIVFVVLALLALALFLMYVTGNPNRLPAELETAVSAREQAIGIALTTADVPGGPPTAHVIRANRETARNFIDNPGVTIFAKSDEQRRSAALALVEQLQGTGARALYVQVEPYLALERSMVDQAQTDKATLPQPKQQITGPAGVMRIDLIGLANRNLRLLDAAELDRLVQWTPR